MFEKVYELGELDSRSNVGVVTAITPLIKYLRKQNLNIEYLTYDRLPKKKVFWFYKFLSTLSLRSPSLGVSNNFRNLWAIRAIQEMGEEDILHIHSFTLLPHMLLSLKIPRNVIITYYGTHSGIIDVGGLTNPYYLRAILNIPDAIIIDETDRNFLLKRSRKYNADSEEILKRKMIMFPFIGIDDEVFDPKNIKPNPWFQKYINNDGLVIFKGGAIESMKGDSMLIKIADTVLSNRKDIYFIWGGYFRRYPPNEQAILKKELEQLCEKYPKNAFYLGTYSHTDLPSLLSRADVVPHFHNTVSNCLSTFGREATMMGRYILATNIGWYRDFFQTSNGLQVFDWDTEDKIIQKTKDQLIYLADNINETRKKGLENRKYALKYCSAKVSALQHKKIYEALANNEPIPTTEELLSLAQKVGE
jgi:hypothetical protein